MSARQTDRAVSLAHRLVAPSAASIAAHLVGVFQIPSGADLALGLAPEAPACNHTALCCWVRLELARMADRAPVANVLVAIEERLLEHLQALWPDRAGEVEVPSPAALASALPRPYWEPIQSTVTCDPHKRQPRDWTKHSSPKSMANHATPCTNPHTDTTHTAEKSNVQID